MNRAPILLVEDDEDIQDSLRFFLESEGFSVESAFNGKEALEYLRAGKPACLILLDLMMPVMSGYEFLDRIKLPEEKMIPKIPMILVSAAQDLERTAKENSVQFLKKPINLELLLGALESVPQK